MRDDCYLRNNVDGACVRSIEVSKSHNSNLTESFQSTVADVIAEKTANTRKRYRTLSLAPGREWSETTLL